MGRGGAVLGDMAVRAVEWVGLASLSSRTRVDALTLVMQYKRHVPSLLQLTPAERDGLARLLKASLVRYDNLFK